MTREEVIKGLKVLRKDFSGYKPNEEMFDMAIHALEQTQWIPVSERLPEWDIECLVVDDKGEFGVGFYRDDVGAWDSPSWGWLERKDDVDNHDAYYMPCGIGKVVAWMPLPESYKVKPQERSEDEADY